MTQRLSNLHGSTGKKDLGKAYAYVHLQGSELELGVHFRTLVTSLLSLPFSSRGSGQAGPPGGTGSRHGRRPGLGTRMGAPRQAPGRRAAPGHWGPSPGPAREAAGSLRTSVSQFPRLFATRSWKEEVGTSPRAGRGAPPSSRRGAVWPPASLHPHAPPRPSGRLRKRLKVEQEDRGAPASEGGDTVPGPEPSQSSRGIQRPRVRGPQPSEVRVRGRGPAVPSSWPEAASGLCE